jgi:hypothetical protein
MTFEKYFLRASLAAALLIFTACKSVAVDPGGGIPDADVPYADAAIGTYQGQLRIFGDPKVIIADYRLTATMLGNRPLLSASQDLLGTDCQSRIGKLMTLEVGGAWDVIASFAFDPGNCPERAAGRQVVFYADRNGRSLFTLFKRQISGSGRLPPKIIEYRASLAKIIKFPDIAIIPANETPEENKNSSNNEK